MANPALPMEVRFGHRVHGVVGQDEHGVRLLVGTADGFTEFRCPWVVAADGAHSPVRTSLGVEMLGETYPERFLVVSIGDELGDLFPDLDLVNYVADPEEWLVLLRTPDHWRVLFPVRTEDPDAELTPAAVGRRLDGLLDAAGGTDGTGQRSPRDWEILSASLYEVSRRVAATMRVGRVLLAGDAAHQNSPLGGMGMNSGIQDAVSCGRRLAAVIGAPPTRSWTSTTSGVGGSRWSSSRPTPTPTGWRCGRRTRTVVPCCRPTCGRWPATRSATGSGCAARRCSTRYGGACDGDGMGGVGRMSDDLDADYREQYDESSR